MGRPEIVVNDAARSFGRSASAAAASAGLDVMSQLSLIDDLSAHQRQHDLGVEQASRVRLSDFDEVAVEHGNVGEIAWLEHALSVFLERRPGRPLRVGLDRFFDRQTLVGEPPRSEEHTSELQSRENLVCRLLLEKK